jgi:hypothetical protein
MNYYFLFYQLMETTDRLEKEARYLADHSLSLSPRDGQANRDLLEDCGERIGEGKKMMYAKSRIRKVQLRRTAVAFQILKMAHQRVLNLAGTSFPANENSAKTLWGFLFQAQKDLQNLQTAFSAMAGMSVEVRLPNIAADRSFTLVLKNESLIREEMIKQIERGIEIFDEEREFTDQLAVIRKNLIEARRNMKQFVMNRILFEESDPLVFSDKGLETVSGARGGS